jgi:hypothetical protein
VKQYDYNRKHLEWGRNPYPEIISHSVVKSRENIFNPVSQKYNDESYNISLRKSENLKLRERIAKNYDNSLRNTQTYDIITLKDKLDIFKNHVDYPTEKVNIKKKLENSNLNYNMISNITLDKHNYMPPEKRPLIKSESDVLPEHKISAVNYRDYNIISNNYKFNHEDKIKADVEISKLNAAKNYWKTHDYDPIQAKFYDKAKEEEYLLKRSKGGEIYHKHLKELPHKE